MNVCRSVATILFALLIGFATFQVVPVFAQESSAVQKQDETNLDTQLYLLVATNKEVTGAKLPPAIEPVVKQLRAALPFKNYQLAATLLNRVKNEGRLNLKWIGGPMDPSGAVSATSPSFNEFKINGVKLVRDPAGKDLVRLEGFSFGVRIPILTAAPVATTGAPPIINYENTGLNTEVSMREGEPVIVGTLNIGPSGDAIILVMTVKRTDR